jgi:hypothetical protein
LLVALIRLFFHSLFVACSIEGSLHGSFASLKEVFLCVLIIRSTLLALAAVELVSTTLRSGLGVAVVVPTILENNAE